MLFRKLIHPPIMNSSGISTGISPHQAAIVSKTCTWEPRTHIYPPTILQKNNSFNCVGLNNQGFVFYANQTYSKPYIVSVWGFDDHIQDMVKMLLTKPNVDAIEVNLSCPNMNNDLSRFETVLKKIFSSLEKPLGKPIGVKLGYFSDISRLEDVIRICVSYPIEFFVSINTLPVIHHLQNYGLGGISLKFISLSQIARLSHILHSLSRHDIVIIGVGGCFTGQDVHDFLKVGADAVQIGTCLLSEGIQCFERIAYEFFHAAL